MIGSEAGVGTGESLCWDSGAEASDESVGEAQDDEEDVVVLRLTDDTRDWWRLSRGRENSGEESKGRKSNAKKRISSSRDWRSLNR